MNGDDRHTTPKEQNDYSPKLSQKVKNRRSILGSKASGTISDPVVFSDLRLEVPKSAKYQDKGTSRESAIELDFDDDDGGDHPPNIRGVARSRDFPKDSIPAGSDSSPQSSSATTSIYARGRTTVEEDLSRSEKPPITQVFTKHVRKSKPEPSPILLLHRAKLTSLPKERGHNLRRESDDDDGGGDDDDDGDDDEHVVGPSESPLGPVNGPHVQDDFGASNDHHYSAGPKNSNLPTLGERQSEAASLAKWPQCSACREASIVCDGENPCALCGDALDCDNPIKKSSQTPGVAASIVADESEAGSDLDEELLEASSDNESMRDEILFEIGFFEQQVIKSEKAMAEYQEYRMRGLLNQERAAAKRAPGPVLQLQQSSPFAKLKSQVIQPGHTFCLQIRDGHSGANNNKQASWSSVESTISTIRSDVTSLPRYKSIGRLGPFPLTRNITIGKYNPYFPEDEALEENFRKSKYQEVQDSYKSYEMFSKSVNSQRDCAELSSMWHPFVLDLTKTLQLDVIILAAFFRLEYNVQDMDFADVGIGINSLAACRAARTQSCDKCGLGIEPPWAVQNRWNAAKMNLKLSGRQYVISGLLSYAFQKVTGLKLWHVIRGDASLRQYLEEHVTSSHGSDPSAADSTLCLVCGLNSCSSHGAYNENKELSERRVLLNDSEDVLNDHKMIIRPKRTQVEAEHTCGVFCVEGLEESGVGIRGLHKDGAIRGDFRAEMEDSRTTFDAKALCCSDACFWDVDRRKVFFEDADRPRSKKALTPDQQRAFGNCLEMFLGNERGPCMAKSFVPGVSCVTLFFLMINELRAAQHQVTAHRRPALPTAESQRARKTKIKRKGKDSTTVGERPVFLPCSHVGPCANNPRCTCSNNKVQCEYICGCDKTCDRRFPGCSCRAGSGKVCVESSCECFESSRECDPWLCGSCGVVEVLDQVNKYKEDIRSGRCTNNRLQLGLPARTIKAPSEVQGYGLFAGEDIPKNGFIGEYRGEVISRFESDRRGITYHLSGYEYLFNLNQDQEIDASNFGNKTRFMNNSSEEVNINVQGTVMLCSGLQRVVLSAKRDIKEGEELLYDYAYPEHVRQKFWERGQEPASKNAMTVAPGSKRATEKNRRSGARNGHISRRNKGAADSGEERRQSVHNKKRKRREDDTETTETIDDAFDFDEPVAVVDASDDSDYAGTADNSMAESEESQGSVPESSSEEVDNTTPRGKTRRKAGPDDRRRGGLAQTKAWQTRKANQANGQT